MGKPSANGIFKGNQKAYDITETVVSTVADAGVLGANLVKSATTTLVKKGTNEVAKNASKEVAEKTDPFKIDLQLFAKKTPVQAGEAGSYGELMARGVRGDKITPHHMPQAAAGYTSYSQGGALALPESEHFLTRTYGGKGTITLKTDAGFSFREVLYKDISDIRKIAGSKYDSGLLDLIDYYKKVFPELIKKEKKI